MRLERMLLYHLEYSKGIVYEAEKVEVDLVNMSISDKGEPIYSYYLCCPSSFP